MLTYETTKLSTTPRAIQYKYLYADATNPPYILTVVTNGKRELYSLFKTFFGCVQSRCFVAVCFGQPIKKNMTKP